MFSIHSGTTVKSTCFVTELWLQWKSTLICLSICSRCSLNTQDFCKKVCSSFICQYFARQHSIHEQALKNIKYHLFDYQKQFIINRQIIENTSKLPAMLLSKRQSITSHLLIKTPTNHLSFDYQKHQSINNSLITKFSI